MRREPYRPVRELRNDPFGLPLRYRAAAAATGAGQAGVPWEIIITRDCVVRQPVPSGSSAVAELHRIGDFSAVVVRCGYLDDGAIGVGIHLHAEESGLEIPLHVCRDSREAALMWQAWARALSLPVRMIGRDGALRDPLAAHARRGARAPCRRRRGDARSRRASSRVR